MNARPLLADFAKRNSVGFHREVNFGIDVGGADRDVAEPGSDGIDVHTCEDQVAGCRVSDHMRSNRSARQFGNPRCAPLDEPVNPEAGELRSKSADKHGGIRCAAENFVSQNPFGFRPQRAHSDASVGGV
jgi:hypothetical protein